MSIFSDSHIHIAQIDHWQPAAQNPVCAASHSIEEFERTEKIASSSARAIFVSFGIHPQNPDMALAAFLESLLQDNKINAIGEAGFDLFTAEYKAGIARQRDTWAAQIEAAARFQKPLVIHCRKALHLIFQDSKALSKIPACVFHSFAGSPLEARSILKRGINAYFSFGKPLLGGNKRAIACVQELPLERLLAETDAPYQRLKDETRTQPRDIIRVHRALSEIRRIETEDAAQKIAENFFRVFDNFSKSY